MIPDRYIEYNGKSYPVFNLNIVDQGDEDSAQNMEMIEVEVSVQSLSNVLINSSGSPVNDEASVLDEEIFFYIPDELEYGEASEIADFVSNNCW